MPRATSPTSSSARPFRSWIWGHFAVRLLTYDCFPQFSAQVRKRLATPLAWLLIGAMLAATCAMMVSPRVWTIFAGLLTLIALGIAWPWLTLSALRLWIAFARDRTVEGEEVRVTACVENLWLLPAYGLTLQGGIRRGASECDLEGELAVRLPRCPAFSKTECHWKFVPRQRGEYPVHAPQLATGFPFGLWETTRATESATSLIVWPATFPVGAIPMSASDAMLEGKVSRQRAGTEGELLGVRPYRRGDSPRRIHWAQSARHDRLIVCELESTARPTVRIILDLDSAIHSQGSQGSREWAIRVAASFAKGWLNAGAQIALVGDGIDIPLSSGEGHLRRLLDGLARLPRQSDLPLEKLLEAAAPCGAGMQLLITTDQRQRNSRRKDRLEARWVILKRSGFEANGGESRTWHGDGKPQAKTPWLVIDSPKEAERSLQTGWSEARHGS